MANRRLGLHGHKALVVINFKHGLGRVAHPPDHGCTNLHRVAALVVHLQRGGVQVAGAQRDFLLGLQRVGPAQAFRPVRAAVLAKQREDGAHIGRQHVEAGKGDHGDGAQRHTHKGRATDGERGAQNAENHTQRHHAVAVVRAKCTLSACGLNA